MGAGRRGGIRGGICDSVGSTSITNRYAQIECRGNDHRPQCYVKGRDTTSFTTNHVHQGAQSPQRDSGLRYGSSSDINGTGHQRCSRRTEF